MLSFSNSTRLAAAVAVCALAAPAFADAPPMTLTVNSGAFGKQVNLNPNSVSASGMGTYTGSVAASDGLWNVNYNFSAASATDTAMQSGSMSIQNLSGGEMTFSITLSLPTAAFEPLSGLFNGSISAVLFTSGAGYFRSVDTAPCWLATSGASVVSPLLAAPVNVNRNSSGATLIGSAAFGGSAPSLPAPTFGTNIAVTLSFVLSAGDTASFSTQLGGAGVAIPAPGVLAVLGGAGLLNRRRRR